MNKILKYGLYSVMAAMSLVSVSCTDEYKYDPADPANADNAKAAIEAAKTNFVIEGDEAATFTFNVTRPNGGGAATVALECNNPKVTIPATVNFEAGETSKEVTANVDIDFLESLNCVIKVADKDADIYSEANGHYMLNFSVSRDYAWKTVGTCTVADLTLSQGKLQNDGILLQQYSKDSSKYRLYKPFYYLFGPDNGVTDCKNFVFYLNEDMTPKSVVPYTDEFNLLNQYGFAYYGAGSNYASYCHFEYKEGAYYVGALLTQGGSPYANYSFAFFINE